MASLAHVALANYVPDTPAELPEPGVESVSTLEAQARAGVLRDPAQDKDFHNRLTPIAHEGPTTGPEPWQPGYDRPAMARDIGLLAPYNGPEAAEGLGTHVEQKAGADMPRGGNPEPPFAPRRNSFRLPPPPADADLVMGD